MAHGTFALGETLESHNFENNGGSNEKQIARNKNNDVVQIGNYSDTFDHAGNRLY